ncbi:MAG: RsmB/NOP family class I SAM-dependent RNA methyltransferase [Ignavibacteriales bacterium]|nr:RsmB/NOP family class I SAM-dependent RNA methyltransferase [Ignavibacteriales bacterium]
MKNSIPVGPKIIEYFTDLYGAEWAARYCDYALTEHHPFIRVNRLKANIETLRPFLLDNHSIVLTEVPGVPDVYAVSDPCNVLGKTTAHITGQYYIQSLSSVMPVLALDPQAGERVLDLCAAPGSKTSFIAARMENTGILVANEIATNRTGILSFNIERLSIINTGIINMPGEWLSPRFSEYFDRVLVDVPCSGLGIVHKKGEVSNWWNEDLILRLAQTQYKLLHAAVRMVRPGGTIVYSTCTLTVEENEMVLQKIMQKLPVVLEEFTLPVNTHKGFTEHGNDFTNEELSKSKRMIPWENNSEGFFVAKLRKTDSMPTDTQAYRKHRSPLSLPGRETIRNLGNKLEEYFGISPDILKKYLIVEKSSDLHIAPIDWATENLEDFNRVGIKIGTFDRYGTFIVHTNLVQLMGQFIQKNIVEIETKEGIKRYLEGGTLKGFDALGNIQAAVSYQGMLLGSAVINKGILKSRFPRSFRTQAIELT